MKFTCIICTYFHGTCGRGAIAGLLSVLLYFFGNNKVPICMSNISTYTAGLKLDFLNKIYLQHDKGASMSYQRVLSQKSTGHYIASALL